MDCKEGEGIVGFSGMRSKVTLSIVFPLSIYIQTVYVYVKDVRCTHAHDGANQREEDGLSLSLNVSLSFVLCRNGKRTTSCTNKRQQHTDTVTQQTETAAHSHSQWHTAGDGMVYMYKDQKVCIIFKGQKTRLHGSRQVRM